MYLSCTALSLFLPAIRARSAVALTGASKPARPSLLNALSGQVSPLGFNWRQVALSAAVASGLCDDLTCLLAYPRIEKTPASEISAARPPGFFGAFMIQATWVSLCPMPVLTINALLASTLAALGTAVSITDLIGLLLHVGGLSFEVTADRQKSTWVQEKKDKIHEDDFLTMGLWSKSRHPNYFGESLLWTGIATLATSVLTSGAGTAVMGLSAGLAVSRMPLSENKNDRKYGDREDYKKWKRETPMFIPKL